MTKRCLLISFILRRTELNESEMINPKALRGEAPGSLRNKAMVLGTRAQYLIWSEFLTAVRTNQAQAARALGAPIFDYYA
jgi:hypothetical protein